MNNSCDYCGQTFLNGDEIVKYKHGTYCNEDCLIESLKLEMEFTNYECESEGE